MMDAAFNNISFISNINEQNFESMALALFRYQYMHNQVYKQWVDEIGIEPYEVSDLESIPFLPIRFFKSQNIVTGQFAPEATFKSSGTTHDSRSSRFVRQISDYEFVTERNFRQFYGDPQKFCILALLPSYEEQGDSSLIYMVNHLMSVSSHSRSGYYLYNHHELDKCLRSLEEEGQKTLLIGVSFALLDFIKERKLNLNRTIVMETGGMKGRKREMIRQELHEALKQSFGVDFIHSEYGMTELFSQAYSNGNGSFVAPSWMKILIRDIYDPFSQSEAGRNGVLNIIDLANVDSCAFIATDDLGVVHEDQTFEVMGRLDLSDIRGCNLMI